MLKDHYQSHLLIFFPLLEIQEFNILDLEANLEDKRKSDRGLTGIARQRRLVRLTKGVNAEYPIGPTHGVCKPEFIRKAQDKTAAGINGLGLRYFKRS